MAVLNVVISTPENREGAVRAGLKLGDHLDGFIDVDTVKMKGKYDELLLDELQVEGAFYTTPSRTVLRDIGNWVIGSDENYENTLIWTELSTPRPLSEYDLVHFHNAVPLGGLLAATMRCRLAGVPYVITAHGISKIPELPQSMNMSRIQKLAFKYLFLKPYMYTLRHSSHLIALSNHDREMLKELFPTQSVSVIPNGVSIPDDTVEQPPITNEISPDIPVLLFVGKIISSKGIDDLLTAYQKIEKESIMLVVGPLIDDEYESRLNNFDDGDLRYLGYTNQESLEWLYKRADIFTFPTRSDVFPLVTLEAMAAGTPIISTRVGGIPEQISNRTGVLVPPEEPEELAINIEALIEDSARREKMGLAARQRVEEEYSWEGVAHKTVALYMQILET
ncbi:glycosyltransferase family 4 protein [Halobellus inordinatus]|uniref:glycosyltransferase family 4 protein n=1 Tax=Halobellus inordinatus TaxID=1126236 RepID=UPI0021140F20|nr:glycosyltransferase family 4 protein [Halobellus ramosii]